MKQKITDCISNINSAFESITGSSVEVRFQQNGDSHRPTVLPKDMQGVYVFLTEDHCFKVGKAGPKSKARWNSHHYNLDTKTPSTFAKSIVKDKNHFKSYFAKDKHSEIDGLNKENIKDWIRANISRIEFLLPEENGPLELNFLEALIQYKLKPIYEGKTWKHLSGPLVS